MSRLAALKLHWKKKSTASYHNLHTIVYRGGGTPPIT